MGQTTATQAQMHAPVVALYSFSPHTLTDAGRATKSTEMDKFWSDVKADQTHTLSLLRAELQPASNPPFFMVDGSELLTSLSQLPADMQIAADAHALSDLADVQPTAYFHWVHAASMQGVDTTRPALHILDNPKFSVPVPQHAMTLDQTMRPVYLLLPVDLAKWMDAAIARFGAEKNEAAQQALLTLFFYAQTKDGDAALEAAAHNPKVSEAVHNAASHHQQDVECVWQLGLAHCGGLFWPTPGPLGLRGYCSVLL